MSVKFFDLTDPSQKRAAAELETAGLKLGALRRTNGVVDLDDARVEVTDKVSVTQPHIAEVTAKVGPAALRGLASLSDRTKVLLENFPDGTTLHVRHRIDGVGTRVTIGDTEAKEHPVVVGNGLSGIAGNKGEPAMDIEVTPQESSLAGDAIIRLADPELLADVASFAVSMAQHATETQLMPPK